MEAEAYNQGEEGEEGGEVYVPSLSRETGWQLASRAIQLALNNRVEEAQRLLRTASHHGGDREASLQAQAGVCFLTFMVRSLTYVRTYTLHEKRDHA